MKNIFSFITFILVFSYSHMLMAVDQTCPNTKIILGKTISDSKQLLNKLFPSRWSINGPLCANGYSNLMTNPLDILCNKPIAIERMIIHGFNDTDDVIAVSYILPGNVTTYSPSLLIPIIGNEQTVETNLIPPLLIPLFKVDRGNQLNLITITGKLFIHASSTTYQDKTDLTIYDLDSLKKQQVEFNTCLKDAGILK